MNKTIKSIYKGQREEWGGRETGWTWVQAVLLWASREDRIHHSAQRGISEQWAQNCGSPSPASYRLPPAWGGKWVGLNLICTAPSVLVSDGIWFDSSCMRVRVYVCVCVCVSTTSRWVSRCPSINAANAWSLKFQHQGQGHYLTPLFLFTHFIWYVFTGSVNNNNISNISVY